jgi:uncharacterized protein (TIRG00374 family)
MAETSFLKRRWKLLLNILTLILLLVLVVSTRKQLAETLTNFARIHAWFLLLMIPIELINYHAQTKQYQRLFAIVGNKLDYWFMYKASLELNFVNHVFPSGGVSGLSYFGARLKSAEISGSRATLVQVMKLAMTFLSFELLLLLGVIALAIGGHVNNIVMLVSGALAALMLVGTLAFFYIIDTKARINTFFTAATKLINRLIHLVRPKHPETISIEKAHQAFDDLHENYQQFKHNYKQLKAPFWWAFLANATEVMTVYIVFLAFGHAVNVGAVILAYAIANFAGLVSVLPGGVGIYEGLMTATLVTTGVPAALSLPVIIMYRIVNTILQVPPGYILYQRNLNAPKFSGK